MTDQLETDTLARWFLDAKREFPWREEPSPYAVWVSEIMLQQTQAVVVVPYFERWMQRFPTVKALAEAPLDAVIKEWEGLGYYSRARYLHQGAQHILAEHDGELPSTEEELRKIKGLGDYTVGAILSFAFHKKAAAVDGNVLRVLSRYFLIEDDISKQKTVKAIRTLAQEQLPEKEPWVVAEALIELGATICGRQPKCLECPLKYTCKGFATGRAITLPVKSKKVKVEELLRAVTILIKEDRVLLRKGVEGEVMQDLYEFPYYQHQEKMLTTAMMEQWITEKFSFSPVFQEVLPKETHGFTRYRVQLESFVFNTKGMAEAPQGYLWHPLKELTQLPFSSGHRRVMHHLLAQSLR